MMIPENHGAVYIPTSSLNLITKSKIIKQEIDSKGVCLYVNKHKE